MQKMNEKLLLDWNRSNPEKKPFRLPVYYGSVERCKECNSCYFFNECSEATRDYARLGLKVENGSPVKL